MACDHPSSSWSHSRGFQWGSGLEIGLAMTLSWCGCPPSTPWPTWLCAMEHCPAGKNNPQCWGKLSEQKGSVFFQDDLVHGLMHVSLTKTNRPDSSLSEAPPDHHQSSTKFHSGCKTLWLVGLSRSRTHCPISRPEPHWKPLECDQEEDGWSQTIKQSRAASFFCARSGIKSPNINVKDGEHAKTYESWDWKSVLFHKILISELFLSVFFFY